MPLYDIDVRRLDGTMQSMGEYRGKTLLIVNVASRCGYTPQYAGLEALYRKHKDEGFVVLGFPCNQFGRQEPGDERAILDFCRTNYGVTFPLFAKVEVNGTGAHPLFRLLTRERRGLLWTARIKWNFTKFLVSGSGDVERRYGPSAAPEAIERDVIASVRRRTSQSR